METNVLIVTFLGRLLILALIFAFFAIPIYFFFSGSRPTTRITNWEVLPAGLAFVLLLIVNVLFSGTTWSFWLPNFNMVIFPFFVYVMITGALSSVTKLFTGVAAALLTYLFWRYFPNQNDFVWESLDRYRNWYMLFGLLWGTLIPYLKRKYPDINNY